MFLQQDISSSTDTAHNIFSDKEALDTSINHDSKRYDKDQLSRPAIFMDRRSGHTPWTPEHPFTSLQEMTRPVLNLQRIRS
uniref:Uncharacterized protein n=1 Tax=Caenorhabditis japonica TaxID=281687 RepID=A0A8R1ICX5_CAEJA